MPGGDCFVTAEHAGLLELTADPGERIEAGREIARITTWNAPASGRCAIIPP